MKINFTKKEYRALLDMLYLSDWVMHSHTTELKPNDYQALRKKLLSFYKEMDAEDITEYCKETADYYESRDYEERIHQKFIEPYEEECFWDTLTDRLAERDVIRALGMAAFAALEGMERIKKLDEIAQHYANEFEQHGLEHVQVAL